MSEKVSANINGREIELETGKMAKQANGSVTIRCGDAVLLATAVMSKTPKEDINFLPLFVEYSEKMYSAGKIPGGFFKREARPSTSATLSARLIDRPIRPLFPEGFSHELQVIVTILSYDSDLSPDFLGIIAASAALSVSDIPFSGPIGAAFVGRIDGELKVNPSNEEMEKSDLDIIVAGTKDAILMVEAGADEVDEEIILEAIKLAHESIKQTVAMQETLVQQVSPVKVDVLPPESDSDILDKMKALMGNKIETNLQSGDKQQIEDFLSNLQKESTESFINDDASNEHLVKSIFSKLKKEQIRDTIIRHKIRPDGRSLDEVRSISSEVGVLPAPHGSALFTRGETQSLGIVTLGTPIDEQIQDDLRNSDKKKYYFHYNFPPFSVGEVGFLRTGRRELGHGALAERAIKSILPDYSDFPYTIRIVSEILESNGSSSMASVCSGTLCLMDCGIPIKRPVSGIAMGLLIDDQQDYVVLSDIQGLEDHYGDMDFKVAGSKKGVTALQLDIKVGGISEDILNKAIYQAKEGRLHILDKMLEVIEKPRDSISERAPRIEFIYVDPEKVGLIIGPGGKMIKKIEEETGTDIFITDGPKGEVSISSKNSDCLNKAKQMILILTKDVEINDAFDGKVVKITNFGAFIELVPGKEGLLHISKIAKRRIDRVEDELEMGQVIPVIVNEIDNQNRINLLRSDLKD
ncbi:MAG: polyribonucleotide nucleotidyltransferase [Candidatus Margulisbacteria bacterium]|nr:polyribonucleotide nucleotidyltransferase [Candidatus Margulisiibacteriota bacterium]